MRHRVVIKYALISETLVATVGSIVLYAYFAYSCIHAYIAGQQFSGTFSLLVWRFQSIHSNLLPAIEFKHSNIELVRANSGRLYLELPTGPSIAKSCAYAQLCIRIHFSDSAHSHDSYSRRRNGKIHITCHTRKSSSMDSTIYPRDNAGDSIHSHALDVEEDTRNPTNDVLTEIVACRDDVREISATQTVIQNDLALIRKDIDALSTSSESILSYCQSLFLSTAPPSAGDDERIRKQLLPVGSIFTTPYITAVVASTLPQYTFEVVRRHGVVLDNDVVQLVLATIVRLDTERIASEATACNAEMKSIIVKPLVVHCAAQAPVRARIPSVEHSEQRRAPASSVSTPGESIQQDGTTSQEEPRLDWMKAGLISAEMFDVVQRELDIADAGREAGARRQKKRKTEADYKVRVSKAVLKQVYVLLHKFFRTGRDTARRSLFEALGFITSKDAQATVTFAFLNRPLSGITDIALMHPHTSASKSVEDDTRNANILRKALDERNEFHVIIK
jgi:hypothetical protein